MRRKFKGLETRALAWLEKTVRFCNNPACELCDIHVKPREVLRKGRREVCPRCFEPLLVRRLRPALPTLPYKPGTSRHPPHPLP